jgi:ribosome-associated toxin RatA of RatAB toxin-antitoxin module
MMGRLAAVLSAFLLLLAGPVARAEPGLRVNADSSWGVVTIEAEMLVPADARTSWSVLTDYNNLARFVPEMKSSRIISRDGEPKRLEQKGESGLLSFMFPEHVILQLDEAPYDRIRFHAVGGSLKSMKGEWRIVGSGNPVRILYRARIVPPVPLPPLLGSTMIEMDVESKLAAIRREIVRRAFAARPS